MLMSPFMNRTITGPGYVYNTINGTSFRINNQVITPEGGLVGSHIFFVPAYITCTIISGQASFLAIH
jgi:hypothetical protein